MHPRTLLVDEHEIVREGIRTLLAKSGKNWEVCGEASNASDAILAIKSMHPQVVVLDVSMPGISGLEAARLIGKLDLSTRVLIFTMYESARLESEVREAGAHGYVSKSQAIRDLAHAIQTLLSGGTFFGSASEPAPGSGEKPAAAPHFSQSSHVPIVYALDSFDHRISKGAEFFCRRASVDTRPGAKSARFKKRPPRIVDGRLTRQLAECRSRPAERFANFRLPAV
jgi:DNA-binding NarL/FixJ family response regulator